MSSHAVHARGLLPYHMSANTNMDARPTGQGAPSTRALRGSKATCAWVLRQSHTRTPPETRRRAVCGSARTAASTPALPGTAGVSQAGGRRQKRGPRGPTSQTAQGSPCNWALFAGRSQATPLLALRAPLQGWGPMRCPRPEVGTGCAHHGRVSQLRWAGLPASPDSQALAQHEKTQVLPSMLHTGLPAHRRRFQRAAKGRAGGGVFERGQH